MREQISVGLDGELSQLESAMLVSHLGRCAACQAYQDDVMGFTQALRTAPLEPIGRTISVQRRRRPVLRGRVQVAAAAALALASLLGAGHFLRTESSQLAPVLAPPARTQITQLPTQQQLEREQLILQRVRVGHPVQIDGLAL